MSDLTSIRDRIGDARIEVERARTELDELDMPAFDEAVDALIRAEEAMQQAVVSFALFVPSIDGSTP
jgi:hypothetical protein